MFNPEFLTIFRSQTTNYYYSNPDNFDKIKEKLGWRYKVKVIDWIKKNFR